MFLHRWAFCLSWGVGSGGEAPVPFPAEPAVPREVCLGRVGLKQCHPSAQPGSRGAWGEGLEVQEEAGRRSESGEWPGRRRGRGQLGCGALHPSQPGAARRPSPQLCASHLKRDPTLPPLVFGSFSHLHTWGFNFSEGRAFGDWLGSLTSQEMELGCLVFRPKEKVRESQAWNLLFTGSLETWGPS